MHTNVHFLKGKVNRSITTPTPHRWDDGILQIPSVGFQIPRVGVWILNPLIPDSTTNSFLDARIRITSNGVNLKVTLKDFQVS